MADAIALRYRAKSSFMRDAGSVLLEMYESDNRLVIDHGASAAPMVDCDSYQQRVYSKFGAESSRYTLFSHTESRPELFRDSDR